MGSNKSKDLLSIVVICHDMVREAPRTVYSLSSRYQKRISKEEYEVIVVDNGSSCPLEKELIESIDGNIRYIYYETESRSPVNAVNHAVRVARGDYLGVILDGARIVTPGIVYWALKALRSFRSPFVTTLSWHLGPEVQYKSVPKGYSSEIEDKLLESIDWKNYGYNLFIKSCFAGSSEAGYFQPVAESNAFFLTSRLYDELEGYDEAFDLPGGGLCNLDFYKRACEHPGTEHVILIGEGSFHQHHGGITTSGRSGEDIRTLTSFYRQYESIRKRKFAVPRTEPAYLGELPEQCLRFLLYSVERAQQRKTDK